MLVVNYFPLFRRIKHIIILESTIYYKNQIKKVSNLKNTYNLIKKSSRSYIYIVDLIYNEKNLLILVVYILNTKIMSITLLDTRLLKRF